MKLLPELLLPLFLAASGCMHVPAHSRQDTPFFAFRNLPANWEITVSPGETASIELEENGTTGFQWSLTSPAECPLQLVHLPPKGSPLLAGAPGSCRVTIAPAKKGSIQGKLVYCRSWEKDTPPLYTIPVSITVR